MDPNLGGLHTVDTLVLVLAGFAMLANMAAVFAATLRLAARGSAITERTLASPLMLAIAAVMVGLICSVLAILLVSPAADDLFGATAPAWKTPVTITALTAGAALAAAGVCLVALDLGAQLFGARRTAYTAPLPEDPVIPSPSNEAVG